MKKISVFAAAALVLAAVSCSKEAAPVVIEEAVPSVKEMTFTAIADNGEDTRTILNIDNEHQKYDVVWAAGETIYVAVRHYNVTDMFALDLDKVEVFDSVVEPEIAAVEKYTYTTQPNGAPVEPVDTTALEAKLAEAKALNAEDYTEDSFAALTAAITAAEAVLADEEATQEDVDALVAAMREFEKIHG